MEKELSFHLHDIGPQILLLSAFVGDVQAGYVVANQDPDRPEMIHLETFLVKKDFRRTPLRVGSRLHEKLLEWAIEREAKLIQTMAAPKVLADLDSMITVFEKWGYVWKNKRVDGTMDPLSTTFILNLAQE